MPWLGLTLACATPPPPEPKAQWDQAPPSEQETLESRVHQAGSPAACEQEARHRLATDREGAWKMLRLCTRYWTYTDLRRLLDGEWVAEFTQRRDAAAYLGELIAQRGGDTSGDTELLRAKGVPLLTLTGVGADPAAHVGALIVFRARVRGSAPSPNDAGRLLLAEVQRAGSQGAAAASSSTSTPVAPAASRGHGSRTGRGGSAPQGGTGDDAVEETGRQALAEVGSAPSASWTGDDLLFVAEVKGAARVKAGEVEGSAPDGPLADLRIVRAFHVSPALMY